MAYLFQLFPGIVGLMSGWTTGLDDPYKTVFTVLAIILTALEGYLLGSLNSAIITSKLLYRQDIRDFGSGNAGLTNMYRVYGKKGALFTFLGDFIKQFVAIFIGMIITGTTGMYIAGLFCMIGHIFPVYYRFKGGKGVLTAATMILLLDPPIFAVLFIIFAVVLLFTRYVSLASIVAAFLYPAAVYYAARLRTGNNPPMTLVLFAVFVGLVIIYMHRSNIFRIFNNEENKFSFKSKPDTQKILDAEDKENDAANEYIPNVGKKKKKKRK